MSTSHTSINNLASELLARIFSFLPPNERVRLERVCRLWQAVAKKHAWTEFSRTLTMDSQRNKALAKFRALVDRCAPRLRELRFAGPWEHYTAEQWAKLGNLRHLRFDGHVLYHTLYAVARHLKHLQSVHFSDDIECFAGLYYLLRTNVSLQAVRLPMCTYQELLHPPALPSSLRSLHIGDGPIDKFDFLAMFGERQRDRIDRVLELVASCCPQLAMLMLPMDFFVSERSLIKLAQFDNLFYLRFSFVPSDANLFHNTLATFGTQLTALMLGEVDSKVLDLIAQHCPQLEHCHFVIGFYAHSAREDLTFALQSVLQLSHLRSLSIRYEHHYSNVQLRTQVLTALNGLQTKGNTEYLHLSRELSLPVDFITNLLKNNKLRILTCAIQNGHTRQEMDHLKTQLQQMDGPLELELFRQCPPELKMGENGKVQVRVRKDHFAESISEPMLRYFWAQAMDSVPDHLGNLDD